MSLSTVISPDMQQQPTAGQTPFDPLQAPPYLGRHLLAELYGCQDGMLDKLDRVTTAMCDAAVACGATIVAQKFHHFSPYGVSGVVVIAESHLAIHTWPEYGYAAVDLFTCGDTVDPVVAYHHLVKAFGSSQATFTELKRGTHTAQYLQERHADDRSPIRRLDDVTPPQAFVTPDPHGENPI